MDRLDEHQRKLLKMLAERLQAELGLDDEATCAVLAGLLSDVPSGDARRKEHRLVGRDSFGRPIHEWIDTGREHDGYAPDWLMELLQPHFSARHHWVEGVQRAGFGPDTSLEELYEQL